MRTPQIVLASIAALGAGLLYTRGHALSLMYTNAPSRMPRINNMKDLDIKFADKIQYCEDAVLDTNAGFALLTCDPSRVHWNTVMGPLDNATSAEGTGIYLWQYTDASFQPEKLKLLDFDKHRSDFHPLGIEYQPATQTITVINLAKAGARMEWFKLFPDETAATHLRSLEHPSLSAPNSVTAISDSEYIISNDHYFSRRSGAVLTTIETYLGVSGGSIVYVKADPNAKGAQPVVKTLSRLSFANGVALLNASTFAIASSSLASVELYTIEKSDNGGTPALKHYRTVDVPFHADNLSVDGDGKLLIAGHPHAPSLEELSKSLGQCNAPGNGHKKDCDDKAPSWISEWSERDGLKTLYAGLDFDSSTTALRDVGTHFGFAVGLFGKGLMTWTA